MRRPGGEVPVSPVAGPCLRLQHQAPATATPEEDEAEVTDLLVVGAYFAAMLAVGWRSDARSPEAYWVADRRYGAVPVAASLTGSIFGASSTVGLVGLAYERGLTGAWWALTGALFLVPFALFLAPRVRRLGVITLPDILLRAYGPRVALAGAVVIGVAWCGVVAAQVVAGGLVLQSVLHLPLQGALAVVATVFVLYTFWGGQPSVVRTDFWQLLLFLAGLGIMLALALRAVTGQAPGLEGIPAGHLDFPVAAGFGWYELLVFYPLIVGLPYLVGPDIYARVLSARDERTARRAALASALFVAVIALLLALLGVLIRARFPGLAPERALPEAVVALAPVGVKGLVVAALLAAVMSAADSTLISAATILSRNVVAPLVNGGPEGGSRAHLGPEGQLALTRVFVVLVGAVAWGIAAFQQGIIASLLLAYTVFVGGVVLPTLASFWRERLGVTPTGALWAVGLGGGLAVLGAVARGGILGPGYASLLPIGVSGLALVGGSRLGSRRRP